MFHNCLCSDYSKSSKGGCSVRDFVDAELEPLCPWLTLPRPLPLPTAVAGGGASLLSALCSFLLEAKIESILVALSLEEPIAAEALWFCFNCPKEYCELSPPLLLPTLAELIPWLWVCMPKPHDDDWLPKPLEGAELTDDAVLPFFMEPETFVVPLGRGGQLAKGSISSRFEPDVLLFPFRMSEPPNWDATLDEFLGGHSTSTAGHDEGGCCWVEGTGDIEYTFLWAGWLGAAGWAVDVAVEDCEAVEATLEGIQSSSHAEVRFVLDGAVETVLFICADRNPSAAGGGLCSGNPKSVKVTPRFSSIFLQISRKKKKSN